MQNPLAKYEELIYSIEQAKTIDEALDGLAKADALRAYTRKIGMDLQGQNLFAEAKLRGERRAGELLKAMEKAKPGPKKIGNGVLPNPKLEDLGISKMQSSRYQQTAAVPKPKFEAYIKETKAKKEELTCAGIRQIATGAHVSHNTGDNEWYTPKCYIESARKVLGQIDLDPASTKEANKVVKAKRIYTEVDNGLEKDWKAKTVWLNPPYATGLITGFCLKMRAEIESGNVCSAIVLVNNATETKWFQVLSETFQAVCFPAGRIQFWHPRKVSTPLQGQAILFCGLELDAFAKEFTQYGKVWV